MDRGEVREAPAPSVANPVRWPPFCLLQMWPMGQPRWLPQSEREAQQSAQVTSLFSLLPSDSCLSPELKSISARGKEPLRWFTQPK